MAGQLVGEVRAFCGTAAPAGWLECNGQVLSIASYQPLFDVIGTAFGGDGERTFALPDLRGRVAMGADVFGDVAELPEFAASGGEGSTTLSIAQLPAHTHVIHGRDVPAEGDASADRMLAKGAQPGYAALEGTATMAVDALAQTGASAAFDNLAPTLVLRYCIATSGDVPPKAPWPALRRPEDDEDFDDEAL